MDARGKWDIVTDCESAGFVAERIQAAGEQERLPVRSHPWVPVGTVLAFRMGAFEFGPGALLIEPRLKPLR